MTELMVRRNQLSRLERTRRNIAKQIKETKYAIEYLESIERCDCKCGHDEGHCEDCP